MFNWRMLSIEDQQLAKSILGCMDEVEPQPDLTIAPAGLDRPYLYRWHIVRTPAACVYFHIQVDDDPIRPLHDHPWDNQSVILAGSYQEIISEEEPRPGFMQTTTYIRKKGDVIWRKAAWPHRLTLPESVPYTMTLFSTGPKRREWGFWYPRGWISFEKVTRVQDGVSVQIKPEIDQ